jgi:hypothetical protein
MSLHGEPAAEGRQSGIDPLQVFRDVRPHGDLVHVRNGVSRHVILRVLMGMYRYHDGSPRSGGAITWQVKTGWPVDHGQNDPSRYPEK